MEIRIKTNESLLLSNGWKVMSKYSVYTTYRKRINNKLLLDVQYDGARCKITRLDDIGVKFALKRHDSAYVCLKDMEVALKELKKLEMNNKGTTKIELKRHDILKIQDRKYKWTHFSLVAGVNNSDDRFCRYILYGCPGFNDDFMDYDHSFEIIGVWRYDETADNFVKIYEKEESKKLEEN